MPALGDAVAPTDTDIEMEESSMTRISVSPESNVGSDLRREKGVESLVGGEVSKEDGDGEGATGEARSGRKRRRLVEVDFTGYSPVIDDKVKSVGEYEPGYVRVARAADDELRESGREERRVLLRREAELMRRALEEKERELDALD